MQKEDKNEKGDLATVYEVSYLLLPSLALEQVPARVETLTKMVESAGGELISSENPVLVDLSYPMTKVVHTTRHKCDKGYFGWFKFEMDKDGIAEVKKNFDLDETVLRYLIIKTVRENTLLNGKMQLKGEKEDKKDFIVKEPDLTLPDSSPEEIDKSIDDLVIA
jgi:ribosomal protein S6